MSATSTASSCAAGHGRLVEALELAAGTDDGRLADAQVQVRPAALDERAQQALGGGERAAGRRGRRRDRRPGDGGRRGGRGLGRRAGGAVGAPPAGVTVAPHRSPKRATRTAQRPSPLA
jgi:hypothetical protein